MHCGCGQCSYIHVHCAVDVGHDRVWRSNKSNNYFLVRIIAQNEFILNFFNEMLDITESTFLKFLLEVTLISYFLVEIHVLLYDTPCYKIPKKLQFGYDINVFFFNSNISKVKLHDMQK